MANARRQVHNASYVGRKGKGRKNAEAVKKLGDESKNYKEEVQLYWNTDCRKYSLKVFKSDKITLKVT